MGLPHRCLLIVVTQVRFYLSFLFFILSGVAYLDRTNISIAGLQIGSEYGLVIKFHSIEEAVKQFGRI